MAWVVNGIGRRFLVNDCLTNILTFTMGFHLLQDGVHDKLDRVRSRFFWEKVNGKQKHRMVNWPTICSPKENGGLGVINTRIMNWCLMAKWAWKILTGQGGLWLQIYHNKYLREGTTGGKAAMQNPSLQSPSTKSTPITPENNIHDLGWEACLLLAR